MVMDDFNIINIDIEKSKNEYKIFVGKDTLDDINKFFDLERKVLIVSDDNISETYIDKVYNLSLTPTILKIKHGEENKNFENVKVIIDVLINNNFTRNDVIVAIGGGVIGDMVGFASSIYMRGIDFYNVPTTLLAAVDSSIGGKTAIDYNNIKNVVGSFYQPKGVLIDTKILETLNDRLFANGLVETIKMAAIYNKCLFEFIKNCEDLNDVRKNLTYVITESLKIKKDVVEKDVNEKNLRRILNFGHTIGHAIEESVNGEYLHGECVGMGMLYFSSDIVREELKNILTKFNLPINCNFDKTKAMEILTHDKKTINDDSIYVIKVFSIGSYDIEKMKISDVQKLILGNI